MCELWVITESPRQSMTRSMVNSEHEGTPSFRVPQNFQELKHRMFIADHDMVIQGRESSNDDFFEVGFKIKTAFFFLWILAMGNDMICCSERTPENLDMNFLYKNLVPDIPAKWR